MQRWVFAAALCASIVFAPVVTFADESAEAAKQEENVLEHEMNKQYDECVLKTRVIENEYFALVARDTRGEELSAEEYLFRAYLRTVKWDTSGCFEWKDLAAAKRINKSLKEYVIRGVHPDFRDRMYRLFLALEQKECNEGIRCAPGITSAFRDNYRQRIAAGYKASECRSQHGGSCVTKGWGDGRAIDVVNASDPALPKDVRREATVNLWKFIDQLGGNFGVYRPMKVVDPMHIQPGGGKVQKTKRSKKKKSRRRG